MDLLHSIKRVDVSVQNAVRLGRYDSDSIKPRPMEIVAVSEQHKEKNLEECKTLEKPARLQSSLLKNSYKI